MGLRFCTRTFSSCGKWGPLFIAVRGPLTIAASLVAEHRLQTCRLSSCCSWAQLLHGMWDLPRPGLEPVSPALAGGFSTTAQPGKPCTHNFKYSFRAAFLNSGTLNQIILCCQGLSCVHCEMVCSLPGLYSLDARRNPPPPVMTTKNVSRYCQMSPGGQNCSLLRTKALESNV